MIFKRFTIRCIQIKHIQQFILFLYLLLINSCITEFIPKIDEEKELIVVQGLLTDQGAPVIIKLSTSMPLGQENEAKPLIGCYVTITDDMGNSFYLSETLAGTYLMLSHGIAGRYYTLHIKTNESRNNFTYESFPMKMNPVPQIDSLYYEKRIIRERVEYIEGIEECQIYLDTHDSENNCKFYRWDYSETWMLRLLADVPNQTCWILNNSKNIYINSTAAIREDRIKRHPVTYISNVTDRLKIKYSILVNKYSLNEDEYNYWEKLQKLTEQVGGLYDIIPSAIPSNIMCIENPGEKVLGYFSVSAISSKRIFIEDKFEGIIDDYADCVSDTLIGGPNYIEGLGISKWTLFDFAAIPWSSPRIRIFTETRGCADCTVRGTTIKPSFWTDDK
ncbi:MAG: DUF4249 domain-containing protein [Bacteroidales bacterium]|nr:DUF4249 domain-containing protein [Bacteroidales bacterium]